jgi:hypothetical protein
VGAIALVAVPVLGFAGAADAADGEAGGERGPRPALTDDQRQCLADQGVTVPERPAEGADPSTRVKPTGAERGAFRAAAEACGLPGPPERPGAPGGVQGSSTGSTALAA